MQNFDLKKIINPWILNLKPYKCARDTVWNNEKTVFLDANENQFSYWFDLPKDFENLDLNIYPDPYQIKLKNKLIEIIFKDFKKENIFLSNWSDEVIDSLMRIFCKNWDKILISPPTFWIYEVSANLNNLKILKSNLDENFEICEKNFFEKLEKENPKITFLCTPNNPTWNSLNENFIEKVAKKSKWIVVIDEAYIDFSKRNSSIKLIKKYKNIIVLQTFSKSRWLAWIRLWITISNPEIIWFLNKIKAPYNINSMTQFLWIKSLENQENVLKNIEKNLIEKNFLKKELEKIWEIKKIYNSDANFFLIKFEKVEKLFEFLSSNWILTRYFWDKIFLENCIRISIWTRKINEKLIELIIKFYRK